MRLCIGSLLLLLLLGTPETSLANQQQRTAEQQTVQDPEPFKPNVRPELSLVRANVPINVDGDLDDPGWQAAGVAGNFNETNPGDGVRPPVDVKTLVTYDEDHLYVAFKVMDDPSRIRATLSDRDRLWNDDYVGIILDTYGDNAWAYFMASNPIGVQGDTRIVNGGHEDVGFDVVFSTAGKITDSGYQVEMSIPFRSLRFEAADMQTWKINFWITHPRASRSTYSWAFIDRDDPCWICQMGSITGIQGARPGGKLELLPALTGSQFGSLRSFSEPELGMNNGRVSADPSLGIKYSFSSNLVADVAINPDFSQIESDAAQVDVNTTFALFFPENRPFFQEGSDLFDTRISTVYTRSINNPIATTKVTARFGRNSIGYAGGVDRDSPIILPFEERSSFAVAGRSVSNIVRYRRTLGTSSSVGALVTDRRFTDDGGSGSTFGFDATARLSQTWSLSGQVVGSHTEEPDDATLTPGLDGQLFDGNKTATFDGESFGGFATHLSLNRNARHYGVYASYQGTSPGFRAANGFITQNNAQRISLMQTYTFYFENAFIERITPDVLVGYDWNFDGQRKDEYGWIGVRGQFKGQTSVGIRALLTSNELYRGIDFRGLRRVFVNVNSNFSEPVRLGAFVSIGRSIARNLDVPRMGNNLDLQFWGTVKPTQRLVFEPTISFSRLDDMETGEEYFSGYIVRNRTNFQFTRRLFLRLVTQYNDFSKGWEIDPLVTYKVNPFTAVYIGSTHDFLEFEGPIGLRQTERQLFFKLQYLFRV